MSGESFLGQLDGLGGEAAARIEPAERRARGDIVLVLLQQRPIAARRLVVLAGALGGLGREELHLLVLRIDLQRIAEVEPRLLPVVRGHVLLALRDEAGLARFGAGAGGHEQRGGEDEHALAQEGLGHADGTPGAEDRGVLSR